MARLKKGDFFWRILTFLDYTLSMNACQVQAPMRNTALHGPCLFQVQRLQQDWTGDIFFWVAYNLKHLNRCDCQSRRTNGEIIWGSVRRWSLGMAACLATDTRVVKHVRLRRRWRAGTAYLAPWGRGLNFGRQLVSFLFSRSVWLYLAPISFCDSAPIACVLLLLCPVHCRCIISWSSDQKFAHMFLLHLQALCPYN
jgi:hypothetical protein